MIDVDVLMATILVPLLKMSSIIIRVIPACLVAYSIQRFLYNSHLYQAGHSLLSLESEAKSNGRRPHYEVYLIDSVNSSYFIYFVIKHIAKIFILTRTMH